jgi:hypothetical protein
MNVLPLGAGFLLAFLSPVAAVMMLLGAMRALLTRSDKNLNRDIAALVASAESSRPLWPDGPPLPEVDQVATHGSRAGSALLVLLGVAPSDPSGTNPGESLRAWPASRQGRAGASHLSSKPLASP